MKERKKDRKKERKKEREKELKCVSQVSKYVTKISKESK